MQADKEGSFLDSHLPHLDMVNKDRDVVEPQEARRVLQL